MPVLAAESVVSLAQRQQGQLFRFQVLVCFVAMILIFLHKRSERSRLRNLVLEGSAVGSQRTMMTTARTAAELAPLAATTNELRIMPIITISMFHPSFEPHTTH